MTPPRDSDDVIQLLARNNELLEAVLQELRDQAEQGIAYAHTEVVSLLTYQGVDFPKPLFSIALTNDGPATVEYKLPYRGDADWIAMIPTEVDRFTLIKGRFQNIAFRVLAAGATATVRMKGTY